MYRLAIKEKLDKKFKKLQKKGGFYECKNGL
jgi:hypothetical protein